MPELQTETRKLGASWSQFDAYWAQMSTTKRGSPGLIIVHTIRGLSEHEKSLARAFAKLGFVVVVPDLYSHQKMEVPLEDAREVERILRDVPFEGTFAPGFERALATRSRPDQERLRKAARIPVNAPDPNAVSDLKVCVHALAATPGVDASEIVCLGLSMGGGYTWTLATVEPRVKAAVVFYGRPILPYDQLERLRGAVLAIHAGEDTRLVDLLPEVEQEMSARGRSFTHITYPGVHHGFQNPWSTAYHRACAQDAAKQVLTFLKESLGKLPPEAEKALSKGTFPPEFAPEPQLPAQEEAAAPATDIGSEPAAAVPATDAPGAPEPTAAPTEPAVATAAPSAEPTVVASPVSEQPGSLDVPEAPSEEMVSEELAEESPTPEPTELASPGAVAPAEEATPAEEEGEPEPVTEVPTEAPAVRAADVMPTPEVDEAEDEEEEEEEEAEEAPRRVELPPSRPGIPGPIAKVRPSSKSEVTAADVELLLRGRTPLPSRTASAPSSAASRRTPAERKPPGGRPVPPKEVAKDKPSARAPERPAPRPPETPKSKGPATKEAEKQKEREKEREREREKARERERQEKERREREARAKTAKGAKESSAKPPAKGKPTDKGKQSARKAK